MKLKAVIYVNLVILWSSPQALIKWKLFKIFVGKYFLSWMQWSVITESPSLYKANMLIASQKLILKTEQKKNRFLRIAYKMCRNCTMHSNNVPDVLLCWNCQTAVSDTFMLCHFVSIFVIANKKSSDFARISKKIYSKRCTFSVLANTNSSFKLHFIRWMYSCYHEIKFNKTG